MRWTRLHSRENKEDDGAGERGTGEPGANAAFKFKGLILHEKTHEDSRIGGRQSPPPPALVSAQQKKKINKVRIKTIGLWDTLKKKIPLFCHYVQG